MQFSRFARYLILITVLIFGTILVGAYVVNGGGTINTGQTVQGRIFRDNPQSTCANDKGFPGDFVPSTTLAYAQEGPFAVTATGCATVTWSTPDCGELGSTGIFEVHPIAFSAPFNNSTFISNGGAYLGDPGNSDIFSFSFDVTAGQNIYLVFINRTAPTACSYNYTIDIPAPVVSADVPVYIPLDSRINRFDGGAPVAVYPNSDGGVDIYRITSESTGVFVLRTGDLEVEDCDSSLIAGEGAIGVYRTSDCVFQVNAPQYNGKTYVLRFESVSSTSDYSSHED